MSEIARVPKYRHHNPTGKAVVTLGGRDIYLGTFGSAAGRQEYNRVVGEFLASGGTVAPGGELTIVELLRLYRAWASKYYRKNGKPTATMGRIKVASKPLRELYGSTPAENFGPLALKAIRQRWVDVGLSRRYVNGLVDEIRRLFKWAVGEELATPSVYQALQAVPGLRKGRTTAPERPPVLPVDDATVEATLPHLPAIVADMVGFQRLTGCRPQDVCSIRPRDVDTSGEVWIYRPESHKTEHHGRDRNIFIGPKAQVILRPYLVRSAEDFCFKPADSERKRRAAQHIARKTPLSCGNRPGTNRRSKPKRKAGDCYTKDSYRRAVERAAKLADRKARNDKCDVPAAQRVVPHWSPNQLRHNRATTVRREFGLEAAQIVLGHARADVTQIYAERDIAKGIEIVKKIG